MAPLITHLVIGERVFAASAYFDPADYGPFLLGSVLVDVHVFSDIDRRATHFARRLVNDGTYAFHQSCANFLAQLDDLLVSPWDRLTSAERAFVGGYMSHLAADEEWKRFDWDTLQERGLHLWRDLPVPGEVVLTAFDVLSSALYVDYPAVVSALQDVTVPDLFTHLPHGVLQYTWEVARAHAMDGRTIESYLGMLQRMGTTDAQIEVSHREHLVHWHAAHAAIQNHFGGVQARIGAMVQRSVDVLMRQRARWD